MEPDEPYIDAVTALIDDIARDLILPRFRRLRHEDVERKPTPEDPDDIVTAVDREVLREVLLRLNHLLAVFPEIEELDLNPFFAAPTRELSVAADARLVIAPRA